MKNERNFRTIVTGAAIVGTLAIWALDCVVPFEVSLFVLYLIPIGVAAHIGLPFSGYAVAALAYAFWSFANNTVDPRLQGLLGVWNMFSRAVVFFGIAFYASRHRTLRDEAVRAATPPDDAPRFAPPGLHCEKCGNVSEKGGEWLQPFDYLRSNSPTPIHSCICPNCVGDFLSKENPTDP